MTECEHTAGARRCLDNAFRDSSRRLAPRRNGVCRNDPPERPRRVARRPAVGRIETIAIHGQYIAAFVIAARSELEIRLQQFLQLPFTAVPAETEHTA